MEDNLEQMPLYRKGREILDLVRRIADLIDDDDKQLSWLKGFMLEDAYMLTAKIANAEGGDLYDIRMENAAIIRKASNNLTVHIHSLRQFGFEHSDYYEMVRDKVEEYRLLFIDWVASFDKSNYIIDRWGLFNPTGISPFDEIDDTDDNFNPDWMDDFLNDDDD